MPITSLTRTLMVAALLAGGQLCVAAGANAQAQLPQTQAPVVADIPDQKLNAAATALLQVTRVQQDLSVLFRGGPRPTCNRPGQVGEVAESHHFAPVTFSPKGFTFLSRFGCRPGFVTFRQTFGCRSHGARLHLSEAQNG